MMLALARPGTFDAQLAVFLRSPSRRSRLVAALISLLILAGFFQLLTTSRPSRFASPGPRQAITVFLSPILESPPRRNKESSPQFAEFQVLISEPTLDFESTTAASDAISPIPNPTPPLQGESQQPPTSPAPLQLGTDTLRAAMSTSKSQVQLLAEASGKNLNMPKRNKAEQFAASAEFAGKPGCLRPDALKHNPPRIGLLEVSGVLVLPFMLQAPLRGKCI